MGVMDNGLWLIDDEWLTYSCIASSQRELAGSERRDRRRDGGVSRPVPLGPLAPRLAVVEPDPEAGPRGDRSGDGPARVRRPPDPRRRPRPERRPERRSRV